MRDLVVFMKSSKTFYEHLDSDKMVAPGVTTLFSSSTFFALSLTQILLPLSNLTKVVLVASVKLINLLLVSLNSIFDLI